MARGDVRVQTGTNEFRPAVGETWLLYKIDGDLENWQFLTQDIDSEEQRLFVTNSQYIRHKQGQRPTSIYQGYVQWQ